MYVVRAGITRHFKWYFCICVACFFEGACQVNTVFKMINVFVIASMPQTSYSSMLYADAEMVLKCPISEFLNERAS